jgi:hypothetical protein
MFVKCIVSMIMIFSSKLNPVLLKSRWKSAHGSTCYLAHSAFASLPAQVLILLHMQGHARDIFLSSLAVCLL